jgi:1-aminocyclopropane-1-carboxylate deaminase
LLLILQNYKLVEAYQPIAFLDLLMLIFDENVLHLNLQIPSPIQLIHQHPGIDKGIQIYIKRDDLIHPEISGNKWRKLKYNIEQAKLRNADTLVTAGGAWSNHLAATAAAGKLLNLKTIGIIRGEEPPKWSATLLYCKSQGMEFIFKARREFDRLHDSISNDTLSTFNSFYIPMGGENEWGRLGCEEIMHEITIDFDVLCLPVGTGTTLQGVSNGCFNKNILGFSALNNPSQQSAELMEFVNDRSNVELYFDDYFGGFAKSAIELEDFIVSFYQQNKIILDPVYTGKMMFHLFEAIKKNQFKNGTTIACLHTGGLQGIAGYPDLHRRLFTS